MKITAIILNIVVCLLFLGASTTSVVGAENRSIKRNSDRGEKRVALVIGNGSYRASPLKNPVNDATDMASILAKLDFEVIKEINASKKEMVSALASFSSKLKKAEVGLFYFAGHGMQIDGTNYLIPVGVNVLEESDVEFEAVDAGRVISKMKSAENKLNVVILDACRNNPFKRSFRSARQGLARMDAPKGTIIAYATGPGSVAADGGGRNGIFTKHLLAALGNPNLDIQDVFNQAGMQVMNETNDKQVPWTSNTPIPNYYFAATAGTPSTPVAVQKRKKPSPAKTSYSVQADEELWLAVKGSASLADYEYFLSEYPNSPFAATAILKVRKLKIPEKKVEQTLKPKAGDSYTDPTTGMEFAYVPGGCFQMGDTFGDGQSDEKPVHKVCLDGFYIGKYEVTQGEYRRIIGSNPAKFASGSRYPVEQVSWHDAQTFISSLNSKNGGGVFRLPTEAEWEYAARSGGKNEKYSGSNNVDSVAWYDSNSNSSTHQVGTKSANGLGIYDMSGNVWEWCQDWYGKNSYRSSAGKNPLGPSSGVIRVFRGGGWNYYPRYVRSAFRSGISPDNRNNSLGFRLVLQASSVPGR